MNRCIKTGMSCMALLMGFAMAPAVRAQVEVQRVIVIMVDDLSALETSNPNDPIAPNLYHHLNDGLYPNIKRLAGMGCKFRTFIATPLCSSTRASLLTGLYANKTGIGDLYNRTPQPWTPKVTSPYYLMSAKFTIAAALKAKNFKTGIFGKWHLSGHGHSDDLGNEIRASGFDEHYVWLQTFATPDGSIGVDHRITGNTPDDPETGSASRYGHPGLLKNGKYVDTSASDYGPRRVGDAVLDFVEAHRDEKFFIYYPMLHIHGPFESIPLPTGTVLGTRQNYLKYTDLLVGELLDRLTALSLLNDTLIVFSADNGTNMPPDGSGLPGGGFKGNLTEQGTRVPFIIAGPNVACDTSRQVADVTDIAATIDDLTGPSILGSPVPRWDGKSLRDVLSDATQSGTVGPAFPHKEYALSLFRGGIFVRRDRFYRNGDGTYWSCGDSRNWFACTAVNLAVTNPAEYEAFRVILNANPVMDPLQLDLFNSE